GDRGAARAPGVRRPSARRPGAEPAAARRQLRADAGSPGARRPRRPARLHHGRARRHAGGQEAADGLGAGPQLRAARVSLLRTAVDPASGDHDGARRARRRGWPLAAGRRLAVDVPPRLPLRDAQGAAAALARRPHRRPADRHRRQLPEGGGVARGDRRPRRRGEVAGEGKSLDPRLRRQTAAAPPRRRGRAAAGPGLRRRPGSRAAAPARAVFRLLRGGLVSHRGRHQGGRSQFLPPGARPPQALVLPARIDVEAAGVWACYGLRIIAALLLLLLLLLIAYVANMFRNSSFLKADGLAGQLKPLVWAEFDAVPRAKAGPTCRRS